jgi:tetratricopeptide (TPR) repeat protein
MARPDRRRVPSWLVALLCAAALAAATLGTFWPVTGHAFLNWDDADVVAGNPSLQQPPAALARWAFTATHMGHYQPLSWLALSAIAGAPPSAARVHGAALALHVVNAALLLWLIAALLDRGDHDDHRWWVALGAAALFALHPLRVEPVAWASALPYLLSYAFVLGSAIAWVAWARSDSAAARWTSLALYAVSQLARVTAPILPLALVAIARVVPGAADRSLPALGRAALPFALVAAPLAWLEAGAREPAPLDEIGLAPRAAWALTHPALYVWRTIRPGTLDPVEVLPRMPVADWDAAVVAVLASIAVVALTWQLWSRRAAAAVWGTYVCLLLPVVGLAPSGLQVTAARYVYGPALVLAAGAAALVHRAAAGPLRGVGLAVLGTAALVFAQSAREHLTWWRDSLTLWTRAVAVAPNNDVALYNLALAEIDAGRTDGAIDHLQRLVVLVPDHDLGNARLSQLVADREQRSAEALAASGRFVEAVAAFDRALGADPSRIRARAGRGMARLQLQRLDAAAEDLAAATTAGIDDPAVINALAFAWMSTGRAADAVPLLRRGLDAHPNDVGLAGNLARLLATADWPTLRNPEQALALAAGLNDATGGRDPRVLDTLSLALTATGRHREAAEALDAAIAAAAAQRSQALVAELTARRRALR